MDKTGGPAFPTGDFAGGNSMTHKGMTLRDYFAAKAIQGILAKSFGENMIKATVFKAYEYADAMLAEREK